MELKIGNASVNLKFTTATDKEVGGRGYSAYEIAVQQGFEGTEEEWLASLVGPEGSQGPKGEPGEQGPPGPAASDHATLLNRDAADQHPISAITGLEKALAEAGHQIYRGDVEPTNENILVWIDTSGEAPIIETQLMTVDNKEFITSNNEKFILKEE